MAELKEATDILHYTGTDPGERKKIEIEEEAWRSINAMFAKERKGLQKELAEKNKTIDEKNKAIGEKDKVIDEKEKTINDLAKELEALKRN